MERLQRAVARINDATTKRPGSSTERYNGLDGLYQFLRSRGDGTHERLMAQFEERASRLTAARHESFKQGSLTLWAALRLQKSCGSQEAVSTTG